jgi:hypothetical protein
MVILMSAAFDAQYGMELPAPTNPATLAPVMSTDLPWGFLDGRSTQSPRDCHTTPD